MGRGGARSVVGACPRSGRRASSRASGSEACWATRAIVPTSRTRCGANTRRARAWRCSSRPPTGSGRRAVPRDRVGRSDRDVRGDRGDRGHHRGAGRLVHRHGSVPRAAHGGFRVRALGRCRRRSASTGTWWCSMPGARPSAEISARRHPRSHGESPSSTRSTRVPVPGWRAVPGRRSRGIRPGLRADAVNLYGACHVVEDGRVVDAGPCSRATARREPELRAGRLSASLQGAELVDVRWGGLDVASRIQVTVRIPTGEPSRRPSVPARSSRPPARSASSFRRRMRTTTSRSRGMACSKATTRGRCDS